MSRFKKRVRTEQEIPTGPMADISFLLIIFFMVTTVFVVYRGFPVELPEANSIDTLESRRHVTNVWVGADGRMMVDEFDVDLASLASVVNEKLTENPRIVVLIKSDRNTPYRVIARVIEELRKANALRVSFVARKEL